MDERTPGCWLVGKVKPRSINGKPCETVPRPHWQGSEGVAFTTLMREAKKHEPELYDLFMGFGRTIAFAYLYTPGPTIRRERERMGWSQTKLCRKAKVSIRALREIEHGRSEPRALTVARLLGAMR